MFEKISEGCREIARQMIDHPEDWQQGEYYFANKTNKDIKIWTANGIPALQLMGNIGFNLAERKLLNKAIQKSIAKRLLGE